MMNFVKVTNVYKKEHSQKRHGTSHEMLQKPWYFTMDTYIERLLQFLMQQFLCATHSYNNILSAVSL